MRIFELVLLVLGIIGLFTPVEVSCLIYVGCTGGWMISSTYYYLKWKLATDERFRKLILELLNSINKYLGKDTQDDSAQDDSAQDDFKGLGSRV